MFELLRDRNYERNLGVIVYGRSQEVDRRRCESSGYPYIFNSRSMCCVEATVKPGQLFRIDGAVLADRKILEVPSVFVGCKLLSPSESK